MNERKYRNLLWVILACATVVRVSIAAIAGLSGDEAHYVQYAKHPALSYFDHPPLVGYVIEAFIRIFGKYPLSVRIPALISGILCPLMLFRIGTKMFNPNAGFWAAVTFTLIPLFSAMGSIMVVPDTILAVFWLAIILLLWEIQRTGDARLWYLIGFFSGCCLLTKYTGILVLFSIFIVVVTVPKMRLWFGKKQPYIATLLALAIFSPVIVWNYDNYWVSFIFQVHHGLGEKAFFRPSVFLQNIAGQAGLISPFLFIFILFILFHLARNSIKRDARSIFLLSFSAPSAILFGAASLSNEILPHWPAMGYLSLLVGAGAWIAHLFSIKQFRQKIGRIFVIIALVVGGIFTAVIPGQVLFRILPLRAEIDPTGDLFGWDQAASVLSGIIRSAPDRHYFCFTHKFYLASQIAFYLPEDIELYCLSARIDQYDFWQRDKKLQEKLNKRTGIFFTDEHFKDNPRDLYVFHGKEDRLFLTVHYMGHTREFTFYWCENFDTARTNPRYLNSIPAMSRNLGHTLLNVDNTAFLKINGLAGASKIADRTLWFFGYLGSSEITILLVTLILWIFKRRDFLPFLGTFFLAVAIGSIIVYLLKEAIPATRPSLYFKDVTITVLGPRLKAGSFPSGHSQMVFTAVLFLSWLFPSWLSLFWFLGCCAGFSRVYSGAHFPRDVLAGFIIAVLAFVLARQVMMRVVKFDNSVKKK